tara:strand:- start:688 stop:1206 length:519 start_codon:yes stop_codon:yes gene_type:complete
MTELDKNGRPKIYCANCGKRMNYTYTQQWFGTNGIKTHHYYHLSAIGQVYDTRQEAEARLRDLESTGHDYRGYDGNSNRALEVDVMQSYGSPDRYYVEYSEVIGEAVPFQFHSQQCMMEFLQRADVIQQILPIIEANRAEPKVAKKKPRKKREVKIDLPDYDAMAKRLEGIL